MTVETVNDIDDIVDKEVKGLVKKTGMKAVDVLKQLMDYQYNQAQDIIAGIIVLLEEQNPRRADLLTHMHKEFERARDLSAEYASKLAPYESPKLSAMEVKTEATHRFVMRTPMPAKDTQSWMDQVGAKRAEPKKIEQLTSLDKYDIEDAQEVLDVEATEVDTSEFQIRNDF